MTDKEWKEYRRQAEHDESPEVKTSDVLALLDERDELRKAAKAVLQTSRGTDREREFWIAIKTLRAVIRKHST